MRSSGDFYESTIYGYLTPTKTPHRQERASAPLCRVCVDESTCTVRCRQPVRYGVRAHVRYGVRAHVRYGVGNLYFTGRCTYRQILGLPLQRNHAVRYRVSIESKRGLESRLMRITRYPIPYESSVLLISRPCVRRRQDPVSVPAGNHAQLSALMSRELSTEVKG